MSFLWEVAGKLITSDAALLEGFVVTEVLLLLVTCWFHDLLTFVDHDYWSL